MKNRNNNHANSAIEGARARQVGGSHIRIVQIYTQRSERNKQNTATK